MLADEEDKVVDWGQSDVAEQQHLKIRVEAHLTVMIVALFHQVSDLKCHQHAREEKELVEAEIGRVNCRVAIGLEILLKRPRVVHGRAHSELANT